MKNYMRSYKELEKFLSKGRSKNERPYSENTRIIRQGNLIIVTYYDTVIMSFNEKNEVTINSGGWRTCTTKLRINEFLPAEYHLYQDRSIWYIRKGSRDSKDTNIFFDGFTIPKDCGSSEGKKAATCM